MSFDLVITCQNIEHLKFHEPIASCPFEWGANESNIKKNNKQKKTPVWTKPDMKTR